MRARGRGKVERRRPRDLRAAIKVQSQIRALVHFHPKRIQTNAVLPHAASRVATTRQAIRTLVAAT